MIVSLLAGIIQNARNRRKEAQGMAEAQNQLAERQNQLDGFFRNNYYGDYMNRSEVQSVVQNMQNQMRQQNAQLANMGAITGATPEALAAMQNNNAAAMGNTFNNIAANASGWKSNVLDNYINNSMALTNQRYNLWAQQAADFRNAAMQTSMYNLNQVAQLENSMTKGAGALSGMF